MAVGLALAALGAATGLVVLIGTVGGSKEQPRTTDTANAADTYEAALRMPLRRLNASALLLAQRLALTADPVSIGALKRTAEGQVSLVAAARAQIASIHPPSGQAKAQAQLGAAAADQRSYLVALVRATTLPPTRGLAALVQAHRLAVSMLTAYAAFYRAHPTLADTINGSGVDDLSGARAAIELRRAHAAAKSHASTTATTSEPPTSRTAPTTLPATYDGPFASVDRLETCADTAGSVVTCGSKVSGQVVELTLDAATYLGVGDVVDAGGSSMPEGSGFITTSQIRCSSGSYGLRCRAPSGAAFTIGDREVIVTNRGTTTRYHQ